MPIYAPPLISHICLHETTPTSSLPLYREATPTIISLLDDTRPCPHIPRLPHYQEATSTHLPGL